MDVGESCIEESRILDLSRCKNDGEGWCSTLCGAIRGAILEMLISRCVIDVHMEIMRRDGNEKCESGGWATGPGWLSEPETKVEGQPHGCGGEPPRK